MDGTSSKMKNHENGVIFSKEEEELLLRETIKFIFDFFFQIALTRGSFLLVIVSQKLHSLCTHSALTRPRWVKSRFLPRRHARGNILLKKKLEGVIGPHQR